MSLDNPCSQHILEFILTRVFQTGGMMCSVEMKVTVVKREPDSLSK